MLMANASLANIATAGYPFAAADPSVKMKPNTEIGRWAKTLVESDVAQRYGHMRFGGTSPKPRQGPTPPRTRESSGERFTGQVSRPANQAIHDWSRKLRSTTEIPRRGAPPPKCSFKDTLLRLTASPGGDRSARSTSAGRRSVPSSSRSHSMDRTATSPGHARSHSTGPTGARIRAASSSSERPKLPIDDVFRAEDRMLSQRSSSASRGRGASSSPQPRRIKRDGEKPRSNSRRSAAGDAKEVTSISATRSRSPPAALDQEPLPLPGPVSRQAPATKTWKWSAGIAGSGTMSTGTTSTGSADESVGASQPSSLTYGTMYGYAPASTGTAAGPVPRIPTSSVQYMTQPISSSARASDGRSVTPTLSGTPSTPGMSRGTSRPTTPGVPLQRPGDQVMVQHRVPFTAGQVVARSTSGRSITPTIGVGHASRPI